MKNNELDKALKELVAEGSLSSAQAELVSDRYAASADLPESRKSIFAEIGGYLGGAFIAVAVLTFIIQRFDEVSTPVKSGIFAALAVTLAGISYALGTTSPVRARLASVLAAGSGIATTGSVAIFLDMDRAPLTAFAAGTAVVCTFFYRNRTELLHLASYGFLFITFLMASATITQDRDDAAAFGLASLFWIALGSIWLYVINRGLVHKTLGYLLAAATLFIAIQAQFVRDLHLASYVTATLVVIVLVRIFLRERSWPLLAGAVTIATFSVGEFVAETLGGSLGAIAGLFAAGVALIVSSLYAIRTLQQR
ncbi:Domain of unknown function DUF2157 [Candidatus Nanopelagicaceae bacterium]